MSKSLTLWTVAGQAPLSWDSPVKNAGWVTMPSSRGSYHPRDQTHIFCISSGFFTTEPPRKVEAKVAQLCLTLCNRMDYTVHEILQARILEWVGFPFSRGSSQPRVEPRSPTLRPDSLPAEPQRKPKKTGVGSRFLLQQIFWTQKLNRGLLHCRRILY